MIAVLLQTTQVQALWMINPPPEIEDQGSTSTLSDEQPCDIPYPPDFSDDSNQTL